MTPHSLYVRDLFYLIREAAAVARERREETGSAFEEGRETAFVEVLTTMQHQADAFTIDRNALGMSGFDPLIDPLDPKVANRGGWLLFQLPKVNLELSTDEALVLFDWLVRFNALETTDFADQAEQRVLCVLWDREAILETQLIPPLKVDYSDLLEQARSRVRDV
jgi:hypothetical protein